MSHRRVRGLIAFAVAGLLVTATAGSALAADPLDPAPEPPAVVTVSLSNGAEVPLATALAMSVAKNLPGRLGGHVVGTNVVTRYEGSVYVTYNIYFNRKETHKILVSGSSSLALSYVLKLIPTLPTEVASLVIGIGGATLVLWAGTAEIAGACVGIKTPLIFPKVPIPIYHNSGFCK